MTKKTAIHWFRQDLRLSDNPALTKAAEHKAVLPIYILDNKNASHYAMGSASRWWLHYSLKALDASLNNRLSVYHGNPQTILENIIKHFDAKAVYWNRCYEPWRMHRDTHIQEALKTRGIEVHTCNGSLLWEPWDIKKNDGTPYKVFTPFYQKGCLNAKAPTTPLPRPENVNYINDPNHTGIDTLGLLPKKPWDKKLESHWNIGEKSCSKSF